MRRTGHIVVVAAALAMALSTIGAPVSAAGSGKVAIVNGFPGRSIDICIDNRELKSGLRYGKTFFRTLPAGSKSLKIYNKDRRSCRGQLLARQSLSFPAGSDRTIIMTKSAPRVLTFDNHDFDGPTDPGAYSVGFWRNASDVSDVTLTYTELEITPNPTLPDGVPDTVWPKGAQYSTWTNDIPFYSTTTAFKLANTATYLHEPDIRFVKALYRYEWILIGSKPSNARLVVLKRPIPPVS